MGIREKLSWARRKLLKADTDLQTVTYPESCIRDFPDSCSDSHLQTVPDAEPWIRDIPDSRSDSDSDPRYRIITEPSTHPCSICGWDGIWAHLLKPSALHYNPGRLLSPNDGSERQMATWSPDFGCKSCEIQHRLVQKITNPGKVIKLELNTYIDRFTFDKGNVSIISGDNQSEKNGFSVFIPDKPGQRLPGIPRKAPVPLNTGSEASLGEMRRRLNECTTKHHFCTLPLPGFRPTRLIRVHPSSNERDDVSLVNEEGYPPGVRYLALSYCWGGTRPSCVTNSLSLTARMDRIAWAMLPQTFQDAVIFTRRLGVDYLWVDSVCIIQDDAEDWAREAGRMFEVYRNAYVTLAALHAKDTSGGLFTDLDPEYQFKITEIEHAGETYELFSRRLESMGCPLHESNQGSRSVSREEPLLQRSWCLQERLISPRIIFFGRHGLIWECGSIVYCECERDEWIEYQRNGNATLKQQFLDPENAGSFIGQASPWRAIVVNYTRCKLSRTSDRLVAIGAVAKYLARFRKGEDYLAGMWSGTFWRDFFWTSSDMFEETIDKYLERATDLSNEYVAPTWSWASVGEKVVWSFVELLERSIELLEVKVDTVGSNPFGPAVSGAARVYAHVLACSIAPISYMNSLEAAIFCAGQTLEGTVRLDPRPMKVWKDILKKRSPNHYQLTEVYMVVAGSSYSYNRSTSILCRRESSDMGSNVFSRLGSVILAEKEDLQPFLRGLEKQEIILI